MIRWSYREKSPCDRKPGMRSHAALSSRKPPSTDCSASIECGGTFSDSSWGSFGGAFMGWDYRANALVRKDRWEESRRLAVTKAAIKKAGAGFPAPALAPR